ncbi:unnamed protein product [Urochloa humidicola]
MALPARARAPLPAPSHPLGSSTLPGYHSFTNPPAVGPTSKKKGLTVHLHPNLISLPAACCSDGKTSAYHRSSAPVRERGKEMAGMGGREGDGREPPPPVRRSSAAGVTHARPPAVAPPPPPAERRLDRRGTNGGGGRRARPEREESADPELEPSPAAWRRRAGPWSPPPSSREMRRQSIRPGMSTSAAYSVPPALDP